MNAPDPRWLEILKASGWHTSAITLACVVVVVLENRQVIPTDGSVYWTAVPIIGAVLFGCLSVAAVGRSFVQAVKPVGVLQRRLHRRAFKNSVREYMPHMTERERLIVAYLIHHNQKVFQTHQDGGYAAPLIAKGLVRACGVRGQVMDPTRVTFEVPEAVWAILHEHRSQLPGPESFKDTSAPWAIPWMLR